MRKILANLTMVDVEAGTLVPGMSLWLDGGRITSIRRHDATIEAAAQLPIEYLAGKTVSPGLWDMHVHTHWKWDGMAGVPQTPVQLALRSAGKAKHWLDHGVTGLRVISTPHAVDIQLREAIRAGDVPGPRLFCCGEGITSTGGHGNGQGNEADGPAEFRKLTRLQLKQGADFIKLMATGGVGGRHEKLTAPQCLPDEMQAVTDIARDAGKKVAIHGGGKIGIERALHAGVHSVEHGYEFDMETARMMADKGVMFVPTLAVSDSLEYWKGLQIPDWTLNKLRQAQGSHRQCLEYAMKAGVTMAVGTDLPTVMVGKLCSTVREMEIMVDVGMHPIDVVRAATINATRWMENDVDFGTIAVGKCADLVVVNGNPLENVSVYQQLVSVYIGGELVK